MTVIQSPLARQYDKTVDIYRLGDITGTSKEEFAVSIADVACMIQPIDAQNNEDFSGSYGKDYLMFCDIQDIKEHDKILDGTTEYIVIGVLSHSFLDRQRHMEITIRKHI